MDTPSLIGFITALVAVFALGVLAGAVATVFIYEGGED